VIEHLLSTHKVLSLIPCTAKKQDKKQKKKTNIKLTEPSLGILILTCAFQIRQQLLMLSNLVSVDMSISVKTGVDKTLAQEKSTWSPAND
jgi:hypothetical protein